MWEKIDWFEGDSVLSLYGIMVYNNVWKLLNFGEDSQGWHIDFCDVDVFVKCYVCEDWCLYDLDRMIMEKPRFNLDFDFEFVGGELFVEFRDKGVDFCCGGDNCKVVRGVVG